MKTLIAVLLLLTLAACEREERHFRPEVLNASVNESSNRQSINQPGMALSGRVKSAAVNISMYDDNAFAVNEGKRLYRWYNCNGCHANGGGGIGPALTDSEWRY